MRNSRIAVATASLGLPLKDAMAWAGRQQVAGLSIDSRHELRPGELSQTGRRQLLHQLQDNGLAIASVNLPVRRSFYDLLELDARVAAARQSLELAWQLGAKILTFRAGHVPEDDTPDLAQLVSVLNDLARHGNRVGAIPCVTPSRDKPDRLLKLLSQVVEGPIGINFDPSAFVLASVSAPASYRELHAHVRHFTARDGVRDIDGTGVEVPLGRGEVPWDALAEQFHDADYREWITVERQQGNDKAGDLTRGILYVKQLQIR